MSYGFISVTDGLHGVLAVIERGDDVGTFVDGRHDGQQLLPFFGHPAPTTVWPARLALKLGMALLLVRLERLQVAEPTMFNLWPTHGNSYSSRRQSSASLGRRRRSPPQVAQPPRLKSPA